MSTANEYDFKLYYQPSTGPRLLISKGNSMLDMKNLAKLDSRLHGRAPERYLYAFTTAGTLFNNDEVKHIDAGNLRAHGTSV